MPKSLDDLGVGGARSGGLVRAAFLAIASMAGALALPSCGETGPDGGGASVAPLIAEKNVLQVQVVVPSAAGPLLSLAAADLSSALAAITGASPPLAGSSWPYAIQAVVDPGEASALGEESYRLQSGVVPDGRRGVTITAATEKGAAYGIYHVLFDLGLLYYHPSARFTPPAGPKRLPWGYTGDVESPRFALRGFHEHTQHPIPMSDYYLRPSEDHRGRVSQYLEWLARNRQNAAFFHLLKTVDLDAWLPYIADVAAEAGDLGIGLGLVTSFVDQQQNNYKLVDEASPEPAETQIRQEINKLLAGGFKYLVFQIGSSEFTKPADADVLSWLNVATSHVRSQWPGVEVFAWIHVTCDLMADEGGMFFHLPLQADPDLGALVHTVMFYALDHPAPVYECEDFSHQEAFMDEADGLRRQVWFPETAWWLGFDNNAPLILPVTGWSRQYDIQEGTAKHDVSGHITFTTGREWTYWQYDHYVAQATWDDTLDWAEYVDRLKPMWGAMGDEAAAALKAWTEMQRSDFMGENPLIYFYLAGELPQDEIGAQAGILARQPKLSFGEVYAYDKDAFSEWKSRDYDMLVRMEGDYRAAIAGLPQTLPDGTPQQQALYRELRVGFEVTHQRIAHAIALYSAVISSRAGNEEQAREHLAEAQAITEAMRGHFAQMEVLYRDPVDILAREKPDSLTSYKYGYLAETSTAYFWERRDQQLANFLDGVFSAAEEAWALLPDAVYSAGSGGILLEEPDDPIAGPVIAAFIPPFLFGLEDTSVEEVAALRVHVAEDVNLNGKPDAGTEQVFEGTLDGGEWAAEGISFAVVLRDSTGAVLGDLAITAATLTLDLSPGEASLPTLESGVLAGEIASTSLVQTIMAVGGIDEEGASNLVKSVYQVPSADPLPETLPLRFSLTFAPPT